MEFEEREQRVMKALVSLADTLVAGFDLVELFDDLVASSVDLLELSAAGLLLTDQRGTLRAVASSSEEIRVLELFESQHHEGPCFDCFRSGTRIGADAAEQEDRWPSFAAAMRAVGLGPVYALPMRLREQTIGALALVRPEASPLADHQLNLAQALADVATIAILQHRARLADQLLTEQLQTALTSRIAIEQAKGMIAERAGTSVEQAFDLLRRYARANGAPLVDVAMAVDRGAIAIEQILMGVRAADRPTSG